MAHCKGKKDGIKHEQKQQRQQNILWLVDCWPPLVVMAFCPMASSSTATASLSSRFVKTWVFLATVLRSTRSILSCHDGDGFDLRQKSTTSSRPETMCVSRVMAGSLVPCAPACPCSMCLCRLIQYRRYDHDPPIADRQQLVSWKRPFKHRHCPFMGSGAVRSCSLSPPALCRPAAGAPLINAWACWMFLHHCSVLLCAEAFPCRCRAPNPWATAWRLKQAALGRANAQ